MAHVNESTQPSAVPFDAEVFGVRVSVVISILLIRARYAASCRVEPDPPNHESRAQ